MFAACAISVNTPELPLPPVPDCPDDLGAEAAVNKADQRARRP
jgi:hypothetical protein